MSLTCVSCSTSFTGQFCPTCGEKVLAERDLTIKAYLGKLFTAITSADSKFIRTFRTMITRPGELSEAYMSGKRKPYMTPLSFFLVANLIYFLLPGFETFNNSLKAQIEMMPYRDWSSSIVHTYVEQSGVTIGDYEKEYRSVSTSNAKLLLVFFVFLCSLFIALVNPFRRKFASAYMTFAFEMVAFHLYVNTIAMAVFMYLFIWTAGRFIDDPGRLFTDASLSLVSVVTTLLFLFAAERRYFKTTIAGALWRAITLIGLVYLALIIYRGMLFISTHWMIQ